MGLFSDIFGFKKRRALREEKAADVAEALLQERIEAYKQRLAAAPCRPGPLTAQRAAEQERAKMDEMSCRRRSAIDVRPEPIDTPLYTANGTFDSTSGGTDV